MKINLAYKVKIAEGQKPQDDRELTLNYITAAVRQKYDKGMDGPLRRVWGRLQIKFDKAIETGKNTVELEEAEKDLIKKCIDVYKCDPIIAKYFQILEDEVNKLDKK